MPMISLNVYLGWNKIRDPEFRNDWPRVPSGDRELYGAAG